MIETNQKRLEETVDFSTFFRICLTILRFFLADQTYWFMLKGRGPPLSFHSHIIHSIIHYIPSNHTKQVCVYIKQHTYRFRLILNSYHPTSFSPPFSSLTHMSTHSTYNQASTSECVPSSLSFSCPCSDWGPSENESLRSAVMQNNSKNWKKIGGDTKHITTKHKYINAQQNVHTNKHIGLLLLLFVLFFFLFFFLHICV